MTRTAVVICPGRGTCNKPDLGYLHRHHADRMQLFHSFDATRGPRRGKNRLLRWMVPTAIP